MVKWHPSHNVEECAWTEPGSNNKATRCTKYGLNSASNFEYHKAKNGCEQ